MQDERILSVAMSAQCCSEAETSKVYEEPINTPTTTTEAQTTTSRNSGTSANQPIQPTTEAEKIREKPILLDFHDVRSRSNIEQTKDEFEHLDAKSL
jgi:hypothetical protein